MSGDSFWGHHVDASTSIISTWRAICVMHPVGISQVRDLTRLAMQVRMNWLPSLDGLYLVDRTLAGPNPRRFVPTKTNIFELSLDSSNSTAGESYVWGLYTGRWGSSLASTKQLAITCLTANRALSPPQSPLPWFPQDDVCAP